MNKFTLPKISIIFIAVGLFFQSESAAQSKPSAETISRPAVEYKAEGLRDPFEPYIEEKSKVPVNAERPTENITPPALTVQGIIWGTAIPQAIINNKVVKEGDTLAEVKIIKIEKDKVTVSYAGREFDFTSPAQLNQQKLDLESSASKGGRNEELS